MNQPLRILCVCIGNIARSPTAEAAIRQAAEQAGLAVEVRSAGVAARPGQPPTPRMVALAASRGIEVIHAARQVQKSDLDWADRVFAMDRYTRDRLLAIDGTVDVELFALLDPENGGNEDVHDPEGGTEAEFGSAFGTIERATGALIRSLGRA